MVLKPGLSLAKFLAFVALMVVLTWAAWRSPSPWIDWPAYAALGYLWMSVVTFMHDATHDALFPKKWQNWAFGIVSMIPLMVSFVSFKDDHLEHHRHNRSPRDPDAFTMGRRGVADFIVFYLYFVIGALLTAIHFNLIYPIKNFGPRQWAIHLFETGLKAGAYTALILWARSHGVLVEVLEVWLIPVLFFSLFNSLRFIAEHYQTPWNQGNLIGTRTIISNRVHSFFWNNINWHIGHHVYPRVPWHNLVKLHQRLEPEIHALGAVVDSSYYGVCWNALRRGPESESRLALLHPPTRAA
ncbi:MAG: fatty acid desaturase family protein [Panacagrimonas sp.]